MGGGSFRINATILAYFSASSDPSPNRVRSALLINPRRTSSPRDASLEISMHLEKQVRTPPPSSWKYVLFPTKDIYCRMRQAVARRIYRGISRRAGRIGSYFFLLFFLFFLHRTYVMPRAGTTVSHERQRGARDRHENDSRVHPPADLRYHMVSHQPLSLSLETECEK